MKRLLFSSNTISHSHVIRVRFSEVDSLNIVWHGHYVQYMEEGREAFGASTGISYLDVKNAGYTIPIVHLQLQYKKPLRYGENARIVTTFIDSPAAKIVFRTQIFNDNNELVAEGESIQVFMNSEHELCLQNPEFFIKWKQQLFSNKL